jgi:hypothetical protein
VQITTIPTQLYSSEQLVEQYTNELRTRWLGSWSGKTPFHALKEALISAAVFGDGGQSVEPNLEAREIWIGFQQRLAELLPASLGFRRLRIRIPDIIVEADSGDFLIDDASGGLSAIIELAWQIYLRSKNQSQFTVLLDEPENHLHPALQREIIPSLLRAFPHVQFIIATHSPFVVTSTRDSNVYAFDYNDQNRVESRLLDYVNKAASAEETLKKVLGLDSTFPRWAVRRFDEIVNRYLEEGLSSAKLQSLREELRESGLESEFPYALINYSDRATGGPLS